MSTRIEKDSLGTMEVPSEALYGASTQRAVLNFPVSGRGFGREFIRALGLIKSSCAQANLRAIQAAFQKSAWISSPAPRRK